MTLRTLSRVPRGLAVRQTLESGSALSAGAFVIGLILFGYRGWDGRQSLMPLDVVFVQQSLDPSTPFSGLNTPFGQFDVLRQFSGYLHVVARLFVELFEFAPFSMLPTLIFVVATLIWAGCGWGIFIGVRSVAGAASGLVAATSFALLPPSNIILLSQLNALQWPLLVVCVVLIATDVSPRSIGGQLVVVSVFFATAASAALAFIPLFMLAWRNVARRERLMAPWSLTRWSLIAMTAPFLVQIVAYTRQPGRRAEDLNPLTQIAKEAAYIPKVLLPGSLRGTVTDSLSVGALALLIIIVAGLLTVIVGAVLTSRASASKSATVIVELVTVGACTGVISVTMNGNLNHQYLMIPFASLWIAIVLSIDALTRDPARRRVGIIGALFAVGVFALSGAGTWNKDLHDPFFAQTRAANLAESLAIAQRICELTPNTSADASGTGLGLPCPIIVTLR